MFNAPFVFLACALLACALLFIFSPPVQAGVYMTDEADPVSNFCQAIATTKDTYCPKVKVNCRSYSQRKVGFFIRIARKCDGDITKLSAEEADQAMLLFTDYQNALCCYSLHK